MKQEPSFNKERLKKHIFKEYGISIKKLSFFPVGEVSYSYIVEVEDGSKYFVKLYPPSRIVNKNASKLDSSHSIAYQLYHKENITQVTYPIKTQKGEFNSNFEDSKLVLWSFIDGKMATEKHRQSVEFLQKLGSLLGNIHNLTENLNLDSVSKFDFNLGFKKELLLSIKEATSYTNSSDKHYLKLQKLINQYKNSILESLVYLEEISSKLKERHDIRYVLCHSDPIIHNIIVDNDGELHLVDWDGAILAPFEQDIWFYLNDENFEVFFRKYTDNRNVKTIDEDIVVFLFYERILADLTDWIHRILFEEITKEQMKNDFKGLEEDIWPVLPNMKKIENQLKRNIQRITQ